MPHSGENSRFRRTRKPHDIPSTPGATTSRREILQSSSDPFLQSKISQANQNFSTEGGMLNRLDSATAGLLFFAKTPQIFQNFKTLQSHDRIEKFYLADLHGELRTDEILIETPLINHPHDPRKIFIPRQKNRASLEPKFFKKTKLQKLFFDAQTQTTTVLATITRGARHQIRAHCHKIGHPIRGEKRYFQSDTPQLQLRSIGCKILDDHDQNFSTKI